MNSPPLQTSPDDPAYPFVRDATRKKARMSQPPSLGYQALWHAIAAVVCLFAAALWVANGTSYAVTVIVLLIAAGVNAWQAFRAYRKVGSGG